MTSNFIAEKETTSSQRNPDECAKIATDVAHGKIVMGIKRLCLLRTKNFEPYRNLTADLQHDILEGGLITQSSWS